jgi:Asp-tRNA(Asn)/Glu-tRNA(Gln) amidotransferase A subunit family amidase
LTDDALALRDRLHAKECSAVEVARAFLADVDGDALRAWAAVDAERLLAEAARLDGLDRAARAGLPLFGLPVGVKDNFDTAELPTSYGSPIYAGHRPVADAALVTRIRARGALVAGKTKSTEFAWMHPTDTLNPLDRARTPGGSSSGSAAAVAAGAVRLATGSQTAGSINRPASYCGVVGFKPTFERLPRGGVKPLATSLDTVGLFAVSVGDIELALSAILDVPPPPPPPPASASPAGATARLGFARTPLWSQLEAEAAEAIEAAASSAGATEVELAPGFLDLVRAQTTIQYYETARALAPELERSAHELSDELRAALIEGRDIVDEQYAAAKRTGAQLAVSLGETLRAYDGILTPSTLGPPPLGLHFTGDPVLCRVWTLIGAPCASLPLAWTSAGLPAGVQLVGAPGRDFETLAAARRLMSRDTSRGRTWPAASPDPGLG